MNKSKEHVFLVDNCNFALEYNVAVNATIVDNLFNEEDKEVKVELLEDMRYALEGSKTQFIQITLYSLQVKKRSKLKEGDIIFRDHVFPEKIGEYLQNIDLLSLIEDEYHFSSLSDPYSIRYVFLKMVEDLDVWNNFPWGEHMWRELYGAIRNVNLNHQQGHHKALEMNPNFVLTYSLSGFLLSFKIWILESSCVIDR
nr:hypothetical protein [Tanacetum cinerariifolium]